MKNRYRNAKARDSRREFAAVRLKVQLDKLSEIKIQHMSKDAAAAHKATLARIESELATLAKPGNSLWYVSCWIR